MPNQSLIHSHFSVIVTLGVLHTVLFNSCVLSGIASEKSLTQIQIQKVLEHWRIPSSATVVNPVATAQRILG